MVDAAVNIAAEQPIEYSAYGALLDRDGNRGPLAAPQNLYLTAGPDEHGRDDSLGGHRCGDRRAVAGPAVGAWTSPEWATEPALATAAGRFDEHDLIDADLEEWCARHSADELVERLWPAGVPVAEGDAAPRTARAPSVPGPPVLRGRDTP